MQHLTPEQLAERWQVGVQTLANLRSKRSGPSYIKCGGVVRYRREDVETYEAHHTHQPAA